MRRSILRACRRSGGTRSASSALPRDPPPDLREIRDAHVAGARERIFGSQQSMPGDRYLKKPLEGKKMMRWYFPSKYSFPDFRVDDYFEMQGERLAPREVHPCMPALDQTLSDVSKNREELRSFFAKVDEETFEQNPSLQDLYGLFRLVDAEVALQFPPPTFAFKEHDPLKVEAEELHSLLTEKLGTSAASELEARIQKVQSMEEVRSILREQAKLHNVLPKLQDMTVYVDYGDVEPASTATDVADDPDDPFGEVVRKPVRTPASLTFGPPSAVGGSAEDRAKSRTEAEKELTKLTKDPAVGPYMSKRHRFIDPMFRRRRLKWLERQMANKNKPTEVKFNDFYATHPDQHKTWPTNKGSVTVVWPSPYH